MKAHSKSSGLSRRFSVKSIKRTALAMAAALGISVASMSYVEARTFITYEEDPFTGEVIITQYNDYHDYYRNRSYHEDDANAGLFFERN